MTDSLAQVAIAVPLRRLFDYLIPAGMQVTVGSRVRVPFGRSRVIGVITGLTERSDLPADRLKPLAAVLDPDPLLDRDDLAFLRWVASYYHHPVGEVLAAALPLRLRRADRALLPGQAAWRLTAAGITQAADPPPRTPGKAITVYKSPTCGCCAGWADYLADNGFKVTVVDREDLSGLKARHGITPELRSCHTAVVDGYAIEGHVPAEDDAVAHREQR